MDWVAPNGVVLPLPISAMPPKYWRWGRAHAVSVPSQGDVVGAQTPSTVSASPCLQCELDCCCELEVEEVVVDLRDQALSGTEFRRAWARRGALRCCAVDKAGCGAGDGMASPRVAEGAGAGTACALAEDAAAGARCRGSRSGKRTSIAPGRCSRLPLDIGNCAFI